MKQALAQKIILLVITVAIILSPITVLADGSEGTSNTKINPGMIDGKVKGKAEIDLGDEYNTQVKKIEGTISGIGMFIAVGALMIIRHQIHDPVASKKKPTTNEASCPTQSGCFILFGASWLAPQIREFGNLGTDVNSVGNAILGLIQIIGTLIAVGIVMVLGIQYLIASTEQRANYKRAMLPYIIGAVLTFSAANIIPVFGGYIANSPTEYTGGTSVDASTYLGDMSSPSITFSNSSERVEYYKNKGAKWLNDKIINVEMSSADKKEIVRQVKNLAEDLIDSNATQNKEYNKNHYYEGIYDKAREWLKN